MAESPAPLALLGGHRLRQRTHVTMACDRCKRKRAKCDGDNPCSRCVDASDTCSYEQGKKDGRKRDLWTNSRVQLLSEQLDQYHSLFNILRTASSHDAAHILYYLRSYHPTLLKNTDPCEDPALLETVQFARSLVYPASTASNSKSTSPQGGAQTISSVSGVSSRASSVDIRTKNTEIGAAVRNAPRGSTSSTSSVST